MPENPDVSQVVDGENVVDPVVQDPSVTDPAAQGQGVEAQAADEQRVPLDRFKEVNDEKNQYKAQLELMQQQFAIQQANPAPQQQQAPQQPQTNFERAVAQLGLTDVDYPTMAQQSQIQQLVSQMDAAQQVQQVQTIMDNNFASAQGDFTEMVGTRNQMGQFIPSPAYTQVYNSQPHLRASMNTAEGAYKVIKAQKDLEAMQARATTAAQQEASQKVAAATAPMSPAAAAGTGVITGQAQVTRAEQEQMEAKVKSGAYG